MYCYIFITYCYIKNRFYIMCRIVVQYLPRTFLSTVDNSYIQGVHVWFPNNQALAFMAQGYDVTSYYDVTNPVTMTLLTSSLIPSLA